LDISAEGEECVNSQLRPHLFIQLYPSPCRTANFGLQPHFYHGERNHQGKDNKLLFPDEGDKPKKPTLLSLITASEARSGIMDAPHE
jgi:hypothetical protein